MDDFFHHFLRFLMGTALIAMVVTMYLLFTTLFGPFTLYHAMGMLLFVAIAYGLGKAVLG